MPLLSVPVPSDIVPLLKVMISPLAARRGGSDCCAQRNRLSEDRWVWRRHGSERRGCRRQRRCIDEAMQDGIGIGVAPTIVIPLALEMRLEPKVPCIEPVLPALGSSKEEMIPVSAGRTKP